MINFSGNNTLGLATHPALLEAARRGLDQYGLGSGASRLISGNMEPHDLLEKALSPFLDREAVLLFPSGFQANTGVIPVLAEEGTFILSDALNHASLIDGIRLSKAKAVLYPHNDVKALANALEKIPPKSPVLVVTESLFSMEGDRAPLAEIAALKDVRPFLLYVDEAHAIGALGPDGRGLAAEYGVDANVDLLLGTLGKAFGVSGAFIAGSAGLRDLVINRARSFLYTTAPPPVLALAALAALDEVRRGEPLRERLRENAAHLRERFGAILGSPLKGQDHIIPVPVPGADRVMRACAGLLERGVFCQGIRPPTVPPGQCRLRFSLSANHNSEHLERAVRALEEVLSNLGAADGTA